jgi:hypothetical protein
MIRGRSRIMSCKSGAAGDLYNQDRLPGDVSSDRRLGRAGRHANIYLCPAPREISLIRHCRIHKDTSPGTEGSLGTGCGTGAYDSTVGRTTFRGITEDGEARPQAETRPTTRGSPERTFGNGVGNVTPKRKDLGFSTLCR